MFGKKKVKPSYPHERFERQSMKRTGDVLLMGHHVWTLEVLSRFFDMSIQYVTETDDNDISDYYDQKFMWTIEGLDCSSDCFHICDFATLKEAQMALEFIIDQLATYQKEANKEDIDEVKNEE